MYITSATVNFFCCNNMAAFFIRIDLMYSTGDIPVRLFNFPVNLLITDTG